MYLSQFKKINDTIKSPPSENKKFNQNNIKKILDNLNTNNDYKNLSNINL